MQFRKTIVMFNANHRMEKFSCLFRAQHAHNSGEEAKTIMTKHRLVLLAIFMLCLCATGCATDQTDMMNTTAPTVMQTTEAPMTLPDSTGDPMLPIGTDAPGGLSNSLPEAAGVTTVSSARKIMEEIEDELERLSEVTDAQVVVSGNTAAVALRFDSQYQTGIDNRLENMVRDRIKGIVSGVNNVVISSDKTIYDNLESLGDRLENASSLSEIQNELDALLERMRQTA